MFQSEGTALPIIPATEVGCWTYCRGNFFDAKKYGQADAPEMLKMIGVLYGVERRAKRMSAPERLALREKESVPMLDRKTKGSMGKRKIYLSTPVQKLIRPSLEGKKPSDPLFTP